MTKGKFLFNPAKLLDAFYRKVSRSCKFEATDKKSALIWQRRARKRLAECIGFLDQKKVPLAPRVVKTVDRGRYVRRKVVIRTTARSHMPMYVLIPKGVSRPMPCVLALHGHGYGVKDIVGLWEDGTERFTPDGYHKDFACELAKRGFLVVAPEISCFGERHNDWKYDVKDMGTTTCHNVATYAMMLGGSAVGLRVWDGIRAVDYLAGLKEVDMSRLGAMGISGGGMHAFFSTAMDQRIKAVVISGYFCDWKHSILALPHCTCNFVPGLLALGELSDLAGLIAPRPCLIENGSQDSVFPIEHVKSTVRRARKAWDAFGAGAVLQTDYFEGRHQISGAKAYDFLAEQLS
ncbi:MAG: alpha/beta hydrolase family protein [Planctomycetota bacterium]|nr:alpha/beta hydrolase family protein [Planctomycetota bacterium]